MDDVWLQNFLVENRTILKNLSGFKIRAPQELEVRNLGSYNEQKEHRNPSRTAARRKLNDVEETLKEQIETDANSLKHWFKYIIRLAQYFALFPLSGVNETNHDSVRFEWFNKQMVYTGIGILYTVTVEIFAIIRATKVGVTYHNTVDFVFLVSITVTYVLFIQLAKGWNTFLKEWEDVENDMKTYGHYRSIITKLNVMTFCVMTLAVIEHINAIAKTIMDALPCVTPETDLLKAYFVNSCQNIFTFIEYHPIITFPIIWMTLIMSCAWNFMDLFIIIMSIAVADRFKHLNRVLNSVKGQNMPIHFWVKIRVTYNKLSGLTKSLDRLLSPIVLLSFANNLYFICLQLLNSMKPMPNTWHTVYFIYSFSYLVLRTCAVSLYAASVYDQSKEPKEILFSVPSESYCVEVERLLVQVTSDDLALTGCRFFSITRTLVLTVAGTIVTYEIILVQFNTMTADTKSNSTVTCV